MQDQLTCFPLFLDCMVSEGILLLLTGVVVLRKHQWSCVEIVSFTCTYLVTSGITIFFIVIIILFISVIFTIYITLRPTGMNHLVTPYHQDHHPPEMALKVINSVSNWHFSCNPRQDCVGCTNQKVLITNTFEMVWWSGRWTSAYSCWLAALRWVFSFCLNVLVWSNTINFNQNTHPIHHSQAHSHLKWLGAERDPLGQIG